MNHERYDRRRAIANPAHAAVARAIKRGLLKRPREFPCTDCGKPAEQYDHREYAKPLEVEPVCRRCNLKRGPALDSVARLPRQQVAA